MTEQEKEKNPLHGTVHLAACVCVTCETRRQYDTAVGTLLVSILGGEDDPDLDDDEIDLDEVVELAEGVDRLRTKLGLP